MKKIFTLIAAVAFSIGMVAQSTPTKMQVRLTSGDLQTFNISDIDSVYFEGDDTNPANPSGDVKPYKVSFAADFSTGWVKKVMDGDKQVAELCKEFIRTWNPQTNKTMVNDTLYVVYPIGADGKANLAKGMASNGATIEWDLVGDTIKTYTPGSAALSEVFILDGNFVSAPESSEFIETQLQTDLLVDVRGNGDSQTYKIVKIGTQYWMAENLRAVSYADGTPIIMVNGASSVIWENSPDGAYHVYADDMENNWNDYGALYNGYAVINDKGLAPKGWDIASKAQWDKLKKYLKYSTAIRVKANNLSWIDGKPGNNLSGMNILPGGFFSVATGDSSDGTEAAFWTSDKEIDPLFKTENLKAVRIMKTSFSTTSSQAYDFGHSIRCVRK